MKDKEKILFALNEPYRLLGKRLKDACGVKDCERLQYSLGVCHKHYQSAYRYRTRFGNIREQ